MPQVYFVQKLSVALYLLLLLRKTAQENCAVLLSRPIRGAWIEIAPRWPSSQAQAQSRPIRGAWIEIRDAAHAAAHVYSRAPYGARGLKYEAEYRGDSCETGRAPYGARGLKCAALDFALLSLKSRPIRGAWIEIPSPQAGRQGASSRPIRGAWIEIR